MFFEHGNDSPSPDELVAQNAMMDTISSYNAQINPSRGVGTHTSYPQPNFDPAYPRSTPEVHPALGAFVSQPLRPVFPPAQIQQNTARFPQVGDMVVSYEPSPSGWAWVPAVVTRVWSREIVNLTIFLDTTDSDNLFGRRTSAQWGRGSHNWMFPGQQG